MWSFLRSRVGILGRIRLLAVRSFAHSFIHPLAVCQPLSSVVGGGGGGGDGDGDDAYHGSEWAACDPI